MAWLSKNWKKVLGLVGAGVVLTGGVLKLTTCENADTVVDVGKKIQDASTAE